MDNRGEDTPSSLPEGGEQRLSLERNVVRMRRSLLSVINRRLIKSLHEVEFEICLPQYQPVSQNHMGVKQFHSVETQTEATDENMERILFGTCEEILEIYCRKSCYLPHVQDIKLISNRRQKRRDPRLERYNTLV